MKFVNCVLGIIMYIIITSRGYKIFGVSYCIFTVVVVELSSSTLLLASGPGSKGLNMYIEVADNVAA